MCNLWSAYHCPLKADSARQEDNYWDYLTTNWWPEDYSPSSIPISLIKREIGIRIRYLGLLRVRNPLFREKLYMLVWPRLQGRIPLQPVQIERERPRLRFLEWCLLYDLSDFFILFILVAVFQRMKESADSAVPSSDLGAFWKSCFCEWLNGYY